SRPCRGAVGCLAWFKYRVFLSVQAGTDLFTGPILIPLGLSFDQASPRPHGLRTSLRITLHRNRGGRGWPIRASPYRKVQAVTSSRSEQMASAWRRCLVRFLAACGAVLGLTLAVVILIDPYDSGRFPSLGIAGVSDNNQRTAYVSLGRSGKFDAAIVSDSH